jgi:hypothetical protein
MDFCAHRGNLDSSEEIVSRLKNFYRLCQKRVHIVTFIGQLGPVFDTNVRSF